MLTRCVSHVLLALTQTRKIAFRLRVQIFTELGSGQVHLAWYLSARTNINISIETIRANGRKNNKHDGKKRATASGSDPLADILVGHIVPPN